MINAPDITVTRLSETSIRVAIDGDADITNQVYYMQYDDTAWSDGGSRSGDGNVDITGLTTGETYIVVVASHDESDFFSSPSLAAVITVTADEDDGTPTGTLSLPLNLLRNTIIRSSTFRQWIGASGTLLEQILFAIGRIHVMGVGADDVTRPYAVIGFGDDWSAEKSADGTHNLYEHQGSLYLAFEADIAEADLEDIEIAAFKFANKVGTIIDETKVLSGRGGCLNINTIRRTSGPTRCCDELRSADNVEQEFFSIEYSVTWSD